MLQITRVDTLDDYTLDIELSNGHLILLSLKSLLEKDPNYSSLRGEIPFPCPINDGEGVHWEKGPSLSLNKIFALLHKHENNI